MLGADGEPFLRLSGAAVDANLASPTWSQVGRALGRLPKVPADAGAPPQWDRVSDGRLASWADFRSRPPDTEPQIRSDGPIDVKRWTIPLRIGERPVEITGVTAFEPLRPPGRGSDTNRSNLVAVAAGIRGSAVTGRNGGEELLQTPWLTVSSVMSVIHVPLVGRIT